jgi:hypothetical protein
MGPDALADWLWARGKVRALLANLQVLINRGVKL